MTAPSISIAIPVYNQSRTIESTIDSAIRALQPFSGCEIVVSENHSNDGTADLLFKYHDKVRVVRPPIHLGMAANWNYAVKSCSNEWVGMLSGDDKIYASYIPSIRKAILKRPGAVFAMGGWKVVDVQSGKSFNRRVLSLPAITRVRGATSGLVDGPKASFASYCFLRSAFDKVGGFSEEYHLVQDWVLQFELSLVGAFVNTSCIIAEYSIDQNRRDLERCRVPLYCEDFARFCMSTIWKAQDAGVRRSRLINACEIHVARAESMLSRYPEWREKADQSLRPVYELLGREMVCRRASKSLNPINNSSHLFKALIRRSFERFLPG